MKLQNWWFTTLLGTNESMQPPLSQNIESDIVIVGAGAAGLSAAISLMDKGLKVVLLEKNICGGDTSGKSAGFLTPDSELELAQLIRRFGITGAADLWKVATTGVSMMANHISKHKIDCDFQVQDSLFLGIGNGGWQDILEEVESRKLLKFDQQLYTKESLKGILGSDAYSGGVRYTGTFGVDALLYCQGIKKVLLENNVQIYESSEVEKIEDHRVNTHLGSVKAGQVIFCADKLQHSLTHFADNVYHAQTFLSVSEPMDEKKIATMFPEGRYQCWDTDLVYTYFRLLGTNRLLLGGGDMLTTFSKEDVNSSRVIDKVIKHFKEKFPYLADLEFIQFWPGRIDTTRDLLPTVARDEKNPWLHFVLGCVGLPWATFCGDFAARHSYNDAACTDHHYYEYFRAGRDFFVPLWLEKMVGKQIVFSLNNAWAKYYQKDIRSKETRRITSRREAENAVVNKK